MELIDKQKLLEWLKEKTQENRMPYNDYRIERVIAYEGLTKFIESGTFDDHYTQEEIARLKEERDNIRVGRDNERLLKNEAIKQYEAMEARALQAEKERDARYEFDKQRTIRLEEERNALLEGLKEIAEFKKGEALVYVTEIKNIARSIIAKIESTTK
ncbi:hypothetical protein JCM16163A_41330 [Paenibacillus sp. YK5]